MKGIMKIVNSFENSGLLTKGVIQITEFETNFQLDNPLRFRLTRNKKTDFFIAKIKGNKNMSKTLNEYITAFDYAEKACFARCKQQYFSLLIYYYHWYNYLLR